MLLFYVLAWQAGEAIRGPFGADRTRDRVRLKIVLYTRKLCERSYAADRMIDFK